MSIGVTGSREGMTPEQVATFTAILERQQSFTTLIHGDCVGADAQAFEIAHKLHYHSTAWPSTADERWHANTPSELRHPRRPSLERNRIIVEQSAVLYAFPKAMSEEPIRGDGRQSGTWYTVRYALDANVPVVIVWPDGTLDLVLRSAVIPIDVATASGIRRPYSRIAATTYRLPLEDGAA